MKKQKNKKSDNKKSFIKRLFYPNKWNVLLAVLFYFSNYITFFGIIINYPIFYFYWHYTLDVVQKTILAIVHIAYIYVLSCVIVKLLK